MKHRIWQSRFHNRETDASFDDLNDSIEIDIRLLDEEVAATRAHAGALLGAGVYSKEEYEKIASILEKIPSEVASGEIDWTLYEDVHTLVETRLTELTGDAGRKIQTARSRNDQTVTNQRLYMKKELAALTGKIENLQKALLDKAEETIDVIAPGFTHGRPAQPMRFAHYLMAHFHALDRDKARLAGALKRIDVSPAGSGPLAGATFGLNREKNADELGFAGTTPNSLDAISDRDTHMETAAALSIMMVHLSRMAEDLIAFSAPAYGFVKLGDTCCTSSSIMPQKKNPDGLELIRGKTGRVTGALMSLLMTCKGLPMGYQKDLQEDKEPLFDSLDATALCLDVATRIITELELDAKKALEAITPDSMATDMADDLVKQGVPFRKAYEQIAGAVDEGKGAFETGEGLPTPALSVERRNVPGGTGRPYVEAQIEAARKSLD